jgi:hypothetical protein
VTQLSHGDYVANILAVYDRATPEQVDSGRAWYPTAHHIVNAIAESVEADPARVCYALAALSPRNPWRWNVADAFSFAEARAQGRTMPKATTFKRNQLRAWQALGDGERPWLSAAPKVNAFVNAIMGDRAAVVIDTWAYRVAVGEAPKTGSFARKLYVPLALAYTEAAALRREVPADMQAITWLVAQTEGLATHRRGRHDQAFKAGTPAFVKELLS